MQSQTAPPIPRISRLAVLGPGLLGGSVARAAKAKSLADRVCLWARRQEAVDEIETLNLADEASTDLSEIAADADFVVIATPVGVIGDVAGRLLKSGLLPGAIVTDVGSVKATVVNELRPLFQGAEASFVGSHPMAGAEQEGIRASRADLFEGAACILTPDPQSREPGRDAIATVSAFWQHVGCRVFEMTPEEHDASAAAISHVPHVAAAALVNAALGSGHDISQLVGRGFLDTTRVASGASQLWKEILLENRESVIASLGDLRKNLGRVVEYLEGKDEEGLHSFLLEAKELRDSCLPASGFPGDSQQD